MNGQQCIEKQGRVVKVQDSIALIQMNRIEACDACRMKGMCYNATDETPAYHKLPAQDLCMGDHVHLSITPQTGLKAIMVAYLMPFLLLMLTMAVTLSFSVNEGIAGLIGLSSLIPYFLFIKMGKIPVRSFLHIEVHKS